MLTLKKIRKSFATRRILNGVSFSIGDGQRIALVGQNGVGKSTLLKIIAGLEEADRGEVVLKKNALVGYLPQETRVESDETLLTYLKRVSGLSELEEKMRQLEPELASPKAQAAFDELQESYRRLGGFAFGDKAKLFLDGLALSSIPLTTKVSLLSGGQKRKLSLVGVLLRGVDFLLLDEPTNNLDLPALLWLERYLVLSGTTLLIASHDRRFLDHVVQKVVEIDIHNRTAEMFTGNWSIYAEMKARAIRRHKELYLAQEAERERVIASAGEKRNWVVIGKKKNPTDNDKMGRGYRLNRSEQKQGAMAKSLEKRLDRLEDVERPFERPPLEFELALKKLAGKKAVSLARVVIGYPDGFRTAPLSLTLPFGERIALLGMNGAGKSTLLKTITGILPPLKGKISRSKALSFGDLMQEHENIPQKLTPIGYFGKRLGIYDRERVLLLLAQFQFTPEFADTKIERLSPGERVRFILATLVAGESTVLILDEPTNHLDLEAIEALEEALQIYPGTILLVTHDRTLLERMTIDTTYLLEEGKLSLLPDYALYEKHILTKTKRILKRLEERLGRSV